MALSHHDTAHGHERRGGQAPLLGAQQGSYQQVAPRLELPVRLRRSSGFRVQGSGFRVQGSGFRVQGSGFRVQGSGFRVQGSGFRV